MEIGILSRTFNLIKESKQFSADKRGFEISGAEGVMKAKPSYYLTSDKFSKDSESLKKIEN